MPKEKFDALPEYETSPLFDELERLVIRYAAQMTTRVQVDPDVLEQLKTRLTAQQLVQLTMSIAAANFTTRFNEALGTDLETRHAPPAGQT